MRCILVLGLLASRLVAGPPEEERQRLAYFVDVLPGKSAERAMTVWNEWRKGGGAGVPLDGTPYAKLTDAQRAAVGTLMVDMYAVAGDAQKAFKTVALLLDKGLQHPSAEFTKAGHDSKPIQHEASLLMAEARDAMIEEAILEVAKRHDPPWMIGRSDSGNQTSGMKSDLDQTFYVFEKNPKTGEFVRVPDQDGPFIRAFVEQWKKKNPTLTLEMLDVASIEGKNRFPDPRVTTFADYGKEFRGTIAKLRATPGAYTTYGAVLQQMQLRAHAAIRTRNPRAFQRYGPPPGNPDGPWGRIEGFDEDLALDTMFGRGLDPKIMQGHAFGAAMANLVELQHYLHTEKFETKYHLRTWDDAVMTGDLVAMGANEKGKIEYTSLDPAVRRQFNDAFVARLFPDDAEAQRLHTVALEASADLRSFHKGDFKRIVALQGKDAASLSAREKRQAVFGALAMELHPLRYKPGETPDTEIDSILADVEQKHRALAEQFCLHAIHDASDELLGLVFALDGRDKGWIDPEKVRHVVQGPLAPPTSREQYDAEWEKVRSNVSDGAKETLLYAFYDLGRVEGAKLRDRLKKNHPWLGDAIDGLWKESRWQGLRGFMENRGDYLRTWGGKAGEKMALLGERVQRHVLTELGFERVEEAKLAGAWLQRQHLTWTWRKAVRNAVWDPGSLDALAQIVRSFFESGGDPEAVSRAISDEMLMALPVVGQGVSLARGGVGGAVLMGLAMKWPQVGGLLLAYSIGEAAYAIYDVEYAQPKSGNVIDAAFRGFAGPEVLDLGEPGRPAPTWGDPDEAELARLKGEHATASAELEAYGNIGQMERLRRTGDLSKPGQLARRIAQLETRVEELAERRRAAQEAGGGNWFGGRITGAGAVLKQTYVTRFVMKDVQPRIAFLTRGVVDLAWAADPGAGPAAAAGDDPLRQLEASAKEAEAQLQAQRAALATRWAVRIGENRALDQRVRRDSLFLHFRDLLRNTTDDALDRWTAQWYADNEPGLVEELIAAGLCDESARTWRQRFAAWESDPDKGLSPPPQPPIGLSDLQERVRVEVARSRRLFQEHQAREKERLEVAARNLEEAKARFAREMARPGAAALDGTPMGRLAEGLRYLAVPRAAPHLEATLYRVWLKEDANASPEAAAAREYDWQVGSRLSVDDSLYFPPYTIQTNFLGAPGADSVDGIPLLPATRKAVQALTAGKEGAAGAIVVISAFADGAADLSHAMPETWAHLPSVNVKSRPAGGGPPYGPVAAGGKQRYLLDQVVCTVDAPAAGGESLVWYRMTPVPVSGATGWVPTYGEMEYTRPILKVRHMPDGSFTGKCDWLLQFGGIVDKLNLTVTGRIDPATGAIEMTLDGANVRDSNWGKGEGNQRRITGTLRGNRSGGSGDATDWWAAGQTGWQSRPGTVAGTITEVHTYINNTVPKSIADWKSPEEIKSLLEPKTNTTEVRSWRLECIAGPIRGEDAADAKNAPLRRTFSAGATFTFDQLGSAVEGTVKFPNGNTGVMFGRQAQDSFDFDWYDGLIKGVARLTRQADGSWHGGVWHESYRHGTPPKHDLTLK